LHYFSGQWTVHFEIFWRAIRDDQFMARKQTGDLYISASPGFLSYYLNFAFHARAPCAFVSLAICSMSFLIFL
jgi:hypothetical protein